MKITMEADYAIRIVYCLVRSGEKLEARNIASQMNVTLRFTLKILRKLGIAGIIKSYKGVNGGYELNMPPEKITLLKVIEAVDGDVQINRCLDESIACNRVTSKNDCPFHGSFAKINSVLRGELDKVDFASLRY
jgi:Rrf2 family protein